MMTSHEPTTNILRVKSTGWECLPLTAYDIEVLQSRGLTPEIACARGYRSVTEAEARELGFSNNACAGLLIPIYNLAGESDGFMLRPHTPVVGEDGKTRKYLFAAGRTPSLGGTPAGSQEWEQRTHKLRDNVHTPVVVLESMIKGDSFIANADRDVFTISIHGTWNWVSNGATSPELRDVPWRVKHYDRITHRRPVMLIPDSDYAIKPEVAFAWWQFGQALKRKGANVWICHLPTAVDGSKLGPDDAIANGVMTVAQMFESSKPLPNELPAIARQDGPESASVASDRRIATLEADLARANALISAQARLLKSPDLKDKQRSLGFNALTIAAHKASRGEVDTDGRVALSAAEIANDFRPKPETGQPTSETNGDGSRPLARRQTVKATFTELAEAGALDVVMMPTMRTHSSGDRYPDTEILVRATGDLSAAIIDLASYRSGKKRKPYTRQEPCPHCGEVHSRTRIDYCDGCGGVTATKSLPVPDADSPVNGLKSETLAEMDAATAALESASKKFVEAKNDGLDDGLAAHTNWSQNLWRQESGAVTNFVEAEDDTPLVPRCTWRFGNSGETCSEPTEEWDTGYGSNHLCHKHAEQSRRSGAPPRQIVTTSSTYLGEVAS